MWTEMNVNREEVPWPHKHSKQVASSQLAISLWSLGQSPNERPAVTSGNTFILCCCLPEFELLKHLRYHRQNKSRIALSAAESFLAKAVTYADLLQALCQFGPSLEQSCEALKSWRQFRGTGSSWPKTIVHIAVWYI